MSDSMPGPGAVQLAELFHEIYERRAPEFGYTTRTDTRRFDRGSHNGKLMIAVCDEILTWLDLKVTADALARLRNVDRQRREQISRLQDTVQRLKEGTAEQPQGATDG